MPTRWGSLTSCRYSLVSIDTQIRPKAHAEVDDNSVPVLVLVLVLICEEREAATGVDDALAPTTVVSSPVVVALDMLQTLKQALLEAARTKRLSSGGVRFQEPSKRCSICGFALHLPLPQP